MNALWPDKLILPIGDILHDFLQRLRSRETIVNNLKQHCDLLLLELIESVAKQGIQEPPALSDGLLDDLEVFDGQARRELQYAWGHFASDVMQRLSEYQFSQAAFQYQYRGCMVHHGQLVLKTVPRSAQPHFLESHPHALSI